MQNKTSTIITIVIVVLALIALVWPALRRSDNKEGQTATTTTPTTTTSATTTRSGLSPGQAGSVVVTPTLPNGTPTNRVPVPPTTASTPRPTTTVSPLTGTVALKVYFGRTGSAECEDVTSISRVLPNTLAVGRTSLISLLAGPTANERAAGYTTAINSGVRLQSLTITNGVALADFSSDLSRGVAGSCRVQAIRSQITETLKQFPTVKTVVIAVEGKINGVLEP